MVPLRRVLLALRPARPWEVSRRWEAALAEFGVLIIGLGED